jgi:outer membrane autotransporter protein
VGLFEVIGVQFNQGGGSLDNEGTISSSLAGVSFLADGSVSNAGTITSAVGVEFAGQGSLDNTGLIDTTSRAITLEDGGTIVNEAGGVVQSANGRAIQTVASTTAVSVTNRGTLGSTAAAMPAVELRSSSSNTFSNEGDVEASFDAVVIGGPATATNSGSIVSTGGVGVVLEGSGSFTNDGSVTAASTGVRVDTSAAVTNRSSITSSGAEGVRIDGAGSLVNQGTIGGATQAVLVTAGGNVTNRGSLAGGSGAAIAFTGGQANTFTHSGSATTAGVGPAVEMGGGDDLVILQTGATLSADIDGGAGTDSVRLEGSGTFDQGLQNVESLVVNASAWALTGTVAVGDTQVDAGSLRVSGSLAGTLGVNPGGTLLGSGSVGDVSNRGRVAPGDSIGTLSAASYTQEASGELAIEVSAASADRLAVAGSVDLQGGTLAITPVGTFTNAGPYDIVTAGDLGPGQFASVAASPLLTTNLQYTTGAGGRVSLTVALADSFASAAATPNQAAVAQAIDSVFPTATGDLAVVLGGLLALPSEGALQAGFDQLSPEPLGATAQVAFDLSQWHAALLTDHLRDLRLGVPAAPELGGGAPAAALAASVLGERREPGAWTLRANAYGVYSDLEGGSRHAGHDAYGGVFGLGAERWQSERLLLGADLSGGYTRIDSERDDSEIDGVHGRLTGFGSLDLGRGYVDALGSYAYHWFDAGRRIRYDGIDRDARSDHGAHELSAYLGTGLELSRWGFDFGPEATGRYSVLFEEDYRESSAGAASLRVEEREPDSLATRLGLRLSRRWQIDPRTVIVPRLRLGWAHEWLDTSHDLRAAFTSPGAPRFEVSSRQLSRDSLVARVGVRALLGDDIVVEGDYGLDVGRSETMSHQLGLVLRAAF